MIAVFASTKRCAAKFDSAVGIEPVGLTNPPGRSIGKARPIRKETLC
ncbi:MAG: hypothetical protein N838_14170 [Thiohalocapsa sp. PB-PSB1]|nr:MAG: hypothetical protein N838_14170 [Thiohalocapsa sp. PB-PSB1]